MIYRQHKLQFSVLASPFHVKTFACIKISISAHKGKKKNSSLTLWHVCKALGEDGTHLRFHDCKELSE
jgi:hypothetical protein